MKTYRNLAYLLAALLLLFARPALALSYDAKLPAELFSAPALCDYAPCKDVLPQAERFSDRVGQPPYVVGYRGKDVVGYIALSTDQADIPGYSGKPIVTLIGMDAQGQFTGIRILKHSEPILLLGIPETKLLDFIHQYLGHRIDQAFDVGKSKDAIELDAISGATVTVVAENQLILRSARQVARQVGLIAREQRPAAVFHDGMATDWKTLEKEEAVTQLLVTPADMHETDTGQPHLSLWFGVLNAPRVGKSILGESNYQRLMADLKPGETALFVLGAGTGSFKGSGFVRGGIFDRIQFKQGEDGYTLKDRDYLNLYEVRASGHPEFSESAIFIVRDAGFSAAWPYSLIYLGNQQNKGTGQRQFVQFAAKQWLPGDYLQGGRPHVEEPEAAWVKLWKSRAVEIALFALWLIAAAVVYGLRWRLAARSNHKDKRWINWPRYVFWAISIVWVGGVLMAQPSVTQVLTWVHSVIYEWRWELFLSDPFIFIFWWFIFATMLVYGRGLFCGWLCPFGSLSEVINKLAKRVGIRQYALPGVWHNRLKWLKYVIFIGLLAVSLWSMVIAEQLAEVEPFKTTFLVGPWNRGWPYQLFLVLILGASLFIERPFCKYLCPLGAALAIPAPLRRIRLPRKAECESCKACQRRCGAQAIADNGRIDGRECLQCLECLVLYHDDHACPPLAKERRRRQKAGEALTAVARDGYFIPIKPIPVSPAPADTTGSDVP